MRIPSFLGMSSCNKKKPDKYPKTLFFNYNTLKYKPHVPTAKSKMWKIGLHADAEWSYSGRKKQICFNLLHCLRLLF